MSFSKGDTKTIREYDEENVVEYEPGKGRLRFIRNKKVVAELLPPDSWTFVASVANNKHWGTRPSQVELAIVLRAFNGNHSVAPLEGQAGARRTFCFMNAQRESSLLRALSKSRASFELIRRIWRCKCVAD